MYPAILRAERVAERSEGVPSAPSYCIFYEQRELPSVARVIFVECSELSSELGRRKGVCLLHF